MTQSADTAAPVFGVPEIEQLIARDLPEIDCKVPTASLGSFFPWFAAIQGKTEPTLTRPRIALFLASYQEDGQDMLDILAAMQSPRHPLSALASVANADLQIHELGRAASDDEMLHAIAYGMMTTVSGIDLLVVAAANPAHAATAEKLVKTMQSAEKPLESLIASRSMDIAACFGAMLAARLARTPVVADGAGALAAQCVIEKLAPSKTNHILPATDMQDAGLPLPPGGNGAFMIPIIRNLNALKIAK